ncbi:unnamed protein product [Rhodiola kirilowii]
MLIASVVPKSFWAEAVHAACYILNRASLRSMIGKTPYELLRGRKPKISHLKVFGCKCYVHNNGKENLGKFNARSDEGVFDRYSSHSKAYKVYNLRLEQVIALKYMHFRHPLCLLFRSFLYDFTCYLMLCGSFQANFRDIAENTSEQ